jgi:hypothetical protein
MALRARILLEVRMFAGVVVVTVEKYSIGVDELGSTTYKQHPSAVLTAEPDGKSVGIGL